MKIKKTIYVILGCIGVGLGAIGAAIPLLPSVPFLMLAAFFFGKSSTKLHQWFAGTKLYKNNLESFVKGAGMTWGNKRRIILIVTVTMTVGFLMMGNAPVGRWILIGVWIGHILYVTFRVKTIDQKPIGDL